MILSEVIDKLKAFNPVSIFLYGSQANGSINSKSDYEMGIIFQDEKYIGRSDVKKVVQDNQFSIYPFKINELKNYQIDTPFQKNIYIASLILGNAKTIYGEKIIENLPFPQITVNDLIMDTSFNLGYALTSVRVFKKNDKDLANELMYKSMFYSTRNLIFYKTKNLVIGYNNIYNYAMNLDIPQEYKEILEIGYKIRNEMETEIDSSIYFKNITYINKYIIPTFLNTIND